MRFSLAALPRWRHNAFIYPDRDAVNGRKNEGVVEGVLKKRRRRVSRMRNRYTAPQRHSSSWVSGNQRGTLLTLESVRINRTHLWYLSRDRRVTNVSIEDPCTRWRALYSMQT